MWAVICITVQDECWMCIGHIQRLPLTVYFLVSRVSSAITCSTCYFTPSVYLFPSVCPYTFPSLFVWVFFCLFVFAHVCCLQRFEGFRNDKTMPPSLEPSCSGSTEDGSITTNHLSTSAKIRAIEAKLQMMEENPDDSYSGPSAYVYNKPPERKRWEPYSKSHHSNQSRPRKFRRWPILPLILSPATHTFPSNPQASVYTSAPTSTQTVSTLSTFDCPMWGK